MKEYEGKRVVITGGTSGMGLVTAKLLLANGGRVLVTGHNESAVESARQELGPKALVVKSDASSLSDMDSLTARVTSEFGTLDALLVCAGLTRFVPFKDMTEKVYDEVLAVNAKGPYFTIQKLAQ